MLRQPDLLGKLANQRPGWKPALAKVLHLDPLNGLNVGGKV
jgi:hypothetical protein